MALLAAFVAGAVEGSRSILLDTGAGFVNAGRLACPTTVAIAVVAVAGLLALLFVLTLFLALALALAIAKTTHTTPVTLLTSHSR